MSEFGELAELETDLYLLRQNKALPDLGLDDFVDDFGDLGNIVKRQSACVVGEFVSDVGEGFKGY